ncbi:zinc finger protein 112-like isoform X2 [Astatotilapia calliptera]|uniref:zinc finger protein 112-like isoform X2 n=1 Tax=Astatotilapia calliptera TaxID=8154 RepID=UPI000E40A69C|nr:zinc finger protein 112-like isoform X2 [Astatotilapia calliptera]
MPSVQYLREFINERLTAAAEQIFLEFEKTIVQYEEEIDRQRRLLDITWKPQIKLHRTDVPQQQVCEEERSSSVEQEEPEAPQIKEEQEELCSSQEGEQLGLKEEPEVHNDPVQYEEEMERQRRLLDITWKPQIKLHRTDVPQQPVCEEEEEEEEEEEVLPEQQLWNQERSSSVEQEEPEAPQIKEEQEELCSSQEGEQLGLKEETDTFMVTAAEEGEHSEPEAGREQLLTHNFAVADSQDLGGNKNADSRSSRERHKSHNNAENPAMSESHCNFDKSSKSLKCDVCGKTFKFNYQMKDHYSIHTGERPFACTVCGKMFRCSSFLKKHLRTHSDVKPYTCKTCGKKFGSNRNLVTHTRIHTGVKPYQCKTCGKWFRCHSHLRDHIRIHTGEKPYRCETCGEAFRHRNVFSAHVKKSHMLL